MRVKYDALLLCGLYYLFFAFLVASLVSVDGNAVFYAMVMPFVLAGVFLIVWRLGFLGRIHVRLLFLFFLVGCVLIFAPVEKTNLYIRVLVLELLVLIFCFSKLKLSVVDFSKFINSTYLIYFLVSLASWGGLLPPISHGERNSFMISLGGVTFETLYGIGGSTADIDSYSGLVLVWNFFVNKGGRFRYAMVALSAFAVLMTFRFTPIVALLASFLTYLFVVNRFLAFMAVVLPAVGFVGVLLILYFEPTASVPFITPSMDWYTLLWKATHARSSIWTGQMHYYFTEFRFADFLYGPLDERMTVDFVDGDGRVHRDSYNPHNTYLALLFRSSLLFFMFYTLFLLAVAKRSRKSTFPVIFYISIVAYTNASIIGLHNPVFLLVLLYVFMVVPRGKFRAKLDTEFGLAVGCRLQYDGRRFIRG